MTCLKHLMIMFNLWCYSVGV